MDISKVTSGNPLLQPATSDTSSAGSDGSSFADLLGQSLGKAASVSSLALSLSSLPVAATPEPAPVERPVVARSSRQDDRPAAASRQDNADKSRTDTSRADEAQSDEDDGEEDVVADVAADDVAGDDAGDALAGDSTLSPAQLVLAEAPVTAGPPPPPPGVTAAAEALAATTMLAPDAPPAATGDVPPPVAATVAPVAGDGAASVPAGLPLPQTAAAPAAAAQATDGSAQVSVPAMPAGGELARMAAAVQQQAQASSPQAAAISAAVGQAGAGKKVQVDVAVSQASGAAEADAPVAGPLPQNVLPSSSPSVQSTAQAASQSPVVSAQNAGYYSGEQGGDGQSPFGQSGPGFGQPAASTPVQVAGGSAGGLFAQQVQGVVSAAGAAAQPPGSGVSTASAQAGGGAPAIDVSADAGRASDVPVQGVSGSLGSGTTQGTGQTQTASAARETSRLPLTQQQVVEQVKVKITQGAAAGHDTIQIQLKPAEMGRVDVKLTIKDGAVQAHVVADNADTLNALKSDSSSLQQALSDAGLKTDSNSLSFSLRSDTPSSQTGDNSGGRNAGPYGTAGQSLDDGLGDDLFDADVERSRMAAARGGVDIRV